MNAKRGWFVLFLTIVFLSGLGVGVLLSRQLESPAAASSVARQRGRRPVPPPAELAHRLKKDLELNDDQERDLERIFTAGRERLQGLRREVRARFDAEHRDVRAEVDKVLTPEQQSRFDAIVKRMREEDATREGTDGHHASR
ncbi:MAG: hypothetical protein U0Q12_10015 [Vicinamibacterales bacterium]